MQYVIRGVWHDGLDIVEEHSNILDASRFVMEMMAVDDIVTITIDKTRS